MVRRFNLQADPHHVRSAIDTIWVVRQPKYAYLTVSKYKQAHSKDAIYFPCTEFVLSRWNDVDNLVYLKFYFRS